MPVMTRVEFSILWLVGLVYYFVTSPAGMTPLPVAAGRIILGTTIVSLIAQGKRFPMFGLFLFTHWWPGEAYSRQGPHARLPRSQYCCWRPAGSR